MIYRYSPDIENFAGLYPTADVLEWVALGHELNSSRCLAAEWTPPSYVWSDPDVEFHGDFPPVGIECVMSHRAYKVLAPLIAESVEQLAIDVPGGGLTLLHVLDVVDCLDENGSQLFRLPDEKILFVHQYRFDESLTRGHHIFRIPQTRGIEILVSEEFRETVRAAGLKGYCFNDPLPGQTMQ